MQIYFDDFKKQKKFKKMKCPPQNSLQNKLTFYKTKFAFKYKKTKFLHINLNYKKRTLKLKVISLL